MVRVILAFAMALGGAAGDSHAERQVGRIWTYADLLEKSQVVVIARSGRTREVGRSVAHPAFKNVPSIDFETQFVVDAVLKSGVDVPGDSGPLMLRHYRIDIDRWRADHPPKPGQPPPGLVNTGSHLSFDQTGRTYLLFLIRTPHGLEPVSGHVFPHESVFHLETHQGR